MLKSITFDGDKQKLPAKRSLKAISSQAGTTHACHPTFAESLTEHQKGEEKTFQSSSCLLP
jgi:hypothetical protein